MPASIEDQVVDYFHRLFERLFGAPFSERLADQPRLKRNAVLRQVEESADASSQALTRFFLNREIPPDDVARLLEELELVGDRLSPDDLANSLVTPESLVDRLLAEASAARPGSRREGGSIYRVALHTVVQVLILVGPVMAEWQKLTFSTTFELPRRIVNRLTQIGEQLELLAESGRSAADDRYELLYRDYLLQRFYRVDAGTVRMTTSLAVDVRELFVMPRMRQRPSREQSTEQSRGTSTALMDLNAARAFLTGRHRKGMPVASDDKASEPIDALDQVRMLRNTVIVGAPGAGKSTFLEWLQLRLASAEEPLILSGKQAIPLLLRVRQLDPLDLPNGTTLVERALASRDQAALMPPGWIERQLRAGRVLLMLDGLDEVDPELRDQYVIPWLIGLRRRYSGCRFLVSSRPVGYVVGMLADLDVIECDLQDFDEGQVSEYVRHWCTAVRLAQNEPDEEARREGAAEGEQIFAAFKDHPYIRSLAQNPLMLSAICLVNYFEGGELPRDRAVLYRLCVEGLVHNWDQRRGIKSEFGLEEKLRVCREVAIAMQADDRAEYELARVRTIFREALGDVDRADRLLEHVRYRTGLLLERRPVVFAFAHLTFQEYLAARAVHEGNRLGIDPVRLADEHDNGRWNEVIALYCSLTPAPIALSMIESLLAQDDSPTLGDVLAEAYISSRTELMGDIDLKRAVLRRIAIAPANPEGTALVRFPADEVAQVAWNLVGAIRTNLEISHALRWCLDNGTEPPPGFIASKLRSWQSLTPNQLGELVYIVHSKLSFNEPGERAELIETYAAPGPLFSDGDTYTSQAEIALMGLERYLSHRRRQRPRMSPVKCVNRVGRGSRRRRACGPVR